MILRGDCLALLREMPDDSVDAIVTDPPYGLSREPDMAEVLRHWLAGDDYTHGELRKGLKHCAAHFVRLAGIANAADGEPESTEPLVALRVTVSVRPVRVGPIQLDDERAPWKVEVDDDPAPGRLEGVLVEERYREFFQSRRGHTLTLRAREGAACVGVCTCCAEASAPIDGILVGLCDDAPGESDGAPGVVAGARAELRAVLAFDVGRDALELRPAQGADGLNPLLLLCASERVGASARARSLTPVSESASVGGVGTPAHATLTFDLLTHRGLPERVRNPIVSQKGFMGREWDSFVPGPAVWRECLRVCKPGGHLVAFSSTRTEHLLGVALALAGWERRDTLHWAYWSGFPKSLNVSADMDRLAGAEREVVGRDRNRGASKAADGKTTFGDYAGEWDLTAPATPDAIRWQGWGTAAKPAIEPALLCRKPIRESSIARQVLATGTGALNIDGCRYGYGDPAWPGPNDEDSAREKCASVVGLDSNRNGSAYGEWMGKREDSFSPAGRWPANLYACPKASRSERERGCDDLPPMNEALEHHGEGTPALNNSARAGAGASAARRGIEISNGHPTVKPVRLMRWLCRLVTPPGGRICDPFVGSGTTAIAAVLEGFRVVGMELSDDYAAIAEARLAHAQRWPASWTDTAPGAEKVAQDDITPEDLERAGQARLFGAP